MSPDPDVLEAEIQLLEQVWGCCYDQRHVKDDPEESAPPTR